MLEYLSEGLTQKAWEKVPETGGASASCIFLNQLCQHLVSSACAYVVLVDTSLALYALLKKGCHTFKPSFIKFFSFLSEVSSLSEL